jgi:adenylate cyclase
MNGDLDIAYEDMLANSSRALALAPNLAEAHASKGMALYIAGHAEEAIVAFERAIELDPALHEAHYFFGFSCRDAGQFDRAVVHFQRAADLSAADCTSLCILADVYRALGRREQSDLTYRQGMNRIEAKLSQIGENAELLALGAAALSELGEKDRAEEWAKRAISLDPDDYGVRYNAGCTFAVIGKPDVAVEQLDYIFSHTPRARRWLLGIVDHDTQWNSLRGRADFVAFEKRLKAEITQS